MDCTFRTERGSFNYRVGAIIMKDGTVLMARNPLEQREYYYSVGGRVHLGETLTDAILRELKEETGVDCEIDRLACIHENFFTDDDGVPYHEVSVFFVIRPNDALMHIPNGHRTDHGPAGEYLEWIDPRRCEITLYPDFLRTVDFAAEHEFRHFISDERADPVAAQPQEE